LGNITNDLIERDLRHIWHPYTQMKDCLDLPPIPIKKAVGAKLYDYNGNFYYDTISSWWCNIHGHNHPVIKKAIVKQLRLLEHVLFAGFTHIPAVELAEMLVEITPDGLNKVFYSDNGSTAVEVALKMSFQYWKNLGFIKKEKFLSLDFGYHGDTIGAMSVSGVDLYNKKFEPLFFKGFKTPAPYCYRCPFKKTKEDCAMECLSALEEILEKHSEEISAIILEPLLLAAGGMIVYPVEYLNGVKILCEKFKLHLIADEVATGFGRTGKMFACDHAAISPDFMCMSKGITSGYLPIGITMTTEKIYNEFYDEYETKKTFYHGHTYTANPLSCAAAVASIKLFEEENSLEKVNVIERKMKKFLEDVSSLPFVGNVRNLGAVGAIELVKDKNTKEALLSELRVGQDIYKKGLAKNILLRPLGDIIYLFLPYCLKEKELDEIFEKTESIICSL